MKAKTKKIIIIGATSGIGREMALLYLNQGHRVGITGRRSGLLDEIKSQFPEQVLTSCFDVQATDLLIHLDDINKKLNGFDLLIYNAGVGYPSKELNIESEIKTTLTNVNGFVAVANYAFMHFLQQGYGQLAAITSIAGLQGNSWTPAYSASKAFASNYAQSLNMKAFRMQANIAVTDIRPGFINTKEAEGYKRFWAASPEKAAKQIINAIEKKRRVAYVTKRWWLVAHLLKVLPYSLAKRIL